MNLPPGTTGTHIEDRFGAERCPCCDFVCGISITVDEHGMRQQRLVCGRCGWESEDEDE